MPATGRRSERLQRTPFSRVFTLEGGAGPHVPPVYQGLARISGVSQNLGDVTAVRVPSADHYDDFDIVDTILGQKGLPTSTLEARAQVTISELRRMAIKRCIVDIHVHMGVCRNPSDFDQGWLDGHVKIFEQSRFTAYNIDGLGALDGDQNAVVMESLPFTALEEFDVRPIIPQLVAGTTITDEVLDVVVADAVTCGNCGLPSDGNNVVFALVSDSSGSPGIGANVVWTKDAWATANKSPITAFSIGQAPTAMVAQAGYLVVFSNGGLKHAYIRIADLLAGTGNWASTATGYVASKGPNAAINIAPNLTVIAGDGGYLYTLTDPTAGVTVRSAGDLTVQNFTAIDAFANDAVVAVGASNALTVSYDGGITWGLITGPSVGVTLRSVSVQDFNRWLIGNDSGALWYTLDGGATWVQKAFSSQTAGIVRSIKFASRNVGYLGWDQGAPFATSAKLYRTINGGYSWYPVPESGQWPSVARVNRIAIGGDVNSVFAGGLGTDLNDGFLIKSA